MAQTLQSPKQVEGRGEGREEFGSGVLAASTALEAVRRLCGAFGAFWGGVSEESGRTVRAAELELWQMGWAPGRRLQVDEQGTRVTEQTPAKRQEHDANKLARSGGGNNGVRTRNAKHDAPRRRGRCSKGCWSVDVAVNVEVEGDVDVFAVQVLSSSAASTAWALRQARARRLRPPRQVQRRRPGWSLPKWNAGRSLARQRSLARPPSSGLQAQDQDDFSPVHVAVVHVVAPALPCLYPASPPDAVQQRCCSARVSSSQARSADGWPSQRGQCWVSPLLSLESTRLDSSEGRFASACTLSAARRRHGLEGCKKQITPTCLLCTCSAAAAATRSPSPSPSPSPSVAMASGPSWMVHPGLRY